MRRAVLTCLFLSIPSALLADTVVMRDGTRYTGTFLRGSSRQITITEDNGNRRNLNLTNVQQIYFGNSYNDQSSNQRYRTTNDASSTVRRLQDDIRTALNNGNMTNQQRDTLQRASDRLGSALYSYNAGNRVDMQEVRSALSDIRYVIDNSSMNYNDRQRISDDLQQINQLRLSDNGLVNENGTRSRRYDYDR